MDGVRAEELDKCLQGLTGSLSAVMAHFHPPLPGRDLWGDEPGCLGADSSPSSDLVFL